jgi:hypothetical protein
VVALNHMALTKPPFRRSARARKRSASSRITLASGSSMETCQAAHIPV